MPNAIYGFWLIDFRPAYFTLYMDYIRQGYRGMIF